MLNQKEFMVRALLVAVFALLLTAASGCGQQPDPGSATATAPAPDQNAPASGPDLASTPDGAAYPPPPPPASTDTPVEYPLQPAPTQALTGYPAATEQPAGVLLALDRPLNAGDTIISGVGPAGLEVTIRNITFMNEEMATTVIDQNGRFEVTVEPVPAGIRVGLTTTVEASALPEAVRPAEGAINVPQVGYFYDSIVIPSAQ